MHLGGWFLGEPSAHAFSGVGQSGYLLAINRSFDGGEIKLGKEAYFAGGVGRGSMNIGACRVIAATCTSRFGEAAFSRALFAGREFPVNQ